MRSIFPVLALLAACGGAPAEGGERPVVTFLAPTDGALVAAGEVSVSLSVEHFELVSPSETAWRPASPLAWVVPEAQAHDDDGLATGYCALTLDGGRVASLGDTQHALTGVAAGTHTVACELLFEDGDSLEPPVAAEVTFTAE